MILTENKAERRVIYGNSQSKVKALTDSDEEARAAKIDIKVGRQLRAPTDVWIRVRRRVRLADGFSSTL